MFLTIAAAVAYRRGLSVIVGGMCQTDFSGYPDCRDDTIKALQVCLNAGMSANFIIETPLMWIDKAQTWQLAETLGAAICLNSFGLRPILAIWVIAPSLMRGVKGAGMPSLFDSCERLRILPFPKKVSITNLSFTGKMDIAL